MADATTSWDELLDALDHAVAAPDRPVDPAEIARLVRQGMDEGSVDRELDPEACGRWIAALTRTHAAVVAEHPDLDSDTELALLRVVVTRWLHPRRLDRD
ncbi:hypothetical protein [Aeromicrobium terrae]|uniref:BetI-type transcriptional repressor C-terminal domain-containing protein n=1 Tax=Aeromicrobium terrae TaxID=2498846 RepID=A0A5C8NK83_9ACTN|nr:hypothetical protein [Aeromicrobium terrae]TXL62264.1 hypothetical protein FHP06_06090 [Aeromicrobium terrae]